ncbi:MAG: glycoside hydrolase family 97 catalytic domain-containing protein [Muribaculaceae bacterium]
MKSLSFPPSLVLLLTLISCGSKSYVVNSPDGNKSAEIVRTANGEWAYLLQVGNYVVVDSSRIGYRLANGEELLSAEWKVESKKYIVQESTWTPVWGKRAAVPERYNSLLLKLKNKSSKSSIQHMEVELRMYDDGMALRYIFPEGKEKAETELTEYNFTHDPTAWFYNGEYANYGPVKLSEVDSERESNVTLKFSDSLYVNLHEANLIEGDPLRFVSRKGEYSMHIASLPGAEQMLKKGYTSAWRVIMASNTPGKMVDSHLIELLCPDPKMDFSWVKPGVAVWDWRINGAVWKDFSYTMSYPSWIKMVDFAAQNGIKYLVLDANWYGPEFENNSHPTEGDKAKDVQRLIAYGKEKGVGIWLYLNDVGGKKFPIEKTLKQYGDWGAAGVKYGFMKGTPEEKNHWTKKVTRLCAENHLLVDFHDGPVHPYGQMRTTPNAVTREFCHAQLDAHRVFSPTTFCTSVFVNMVAGPLDMNNGMFDLRQGNTTRVDNNQPVPSTLVAEAARTLIVFSGATIIPDIPEYYQKYPTLLDFIAAQQMPWKESRTLAGEIGEYIVMMRQSAEDVYLVGAATNESARDIEVALSFLPEGEYKAIITQDGVNAHYLTNRETLKTEEVDVNSAASISLHLAQGGGACIKITKK